MNSYVSRFRIFLRKRQASKLLRTSRKVHKHTTLILKLDKIGDYILFRNFIEEARKRCPSNGRLILCGNVAWKELAEKLDGSFLDEFIWVDPSTLADEINRIKLCKRIRKTRCSRILCCSYSRTNEIDYVVLRSGAVEKIGFYGDTTNILPEHKKENDAKYTLLVPGTEECMFEFYRNKLLFEYIYNTKIEINKPYIQIKGTDDNKATPYMVLFQGAGHEARRWSTANFASLCRLLYDLYKVPIHICGSKNEFHNAEIIVSQSDTGVINDTGKYSLYETIELIQKAVLVITNDSGPLHLAMAVNTPAVCISNGNHFERFCPYPPAMGMPLITVFPDEFEAKLDKPETRNALRCQDSDININYITPEKVYTALKNSNFLKHA